MTSAVGLQITVKRGDALTRVDEAAGPGWEGGGEAGPGHEGGGVL